MNLAGETEVLGGNLPRRHFVHHKIPKLTGSSFRISAGELLKLTLTDIFDIRVVPLVLQFL
jgi:hypothetical protein